MRKAWFTSLQLLVLIFLFFFFSSLRALPAEAGEADASLQFSLTLAPAEAVVPGDRITRQILLENLTDKKLKYSVEDIRCTGSAELLPYLTLQLAVGEETLFSGQADQLGIMSSFPISIPAARRDTGAGGAVRAEAAGGVRSAEAGNATAEEAGEAAVLQLILDFSPEAKAPLMGSRAEITLLLSAEEVTAVGERETSSAATDETPKETQPVSAETEAVKTDQGSAPETRDAETAVEERQEGDAAAESRSEDRTEPEDAADAATQQEGSEAEQRKESAAVKPGAGNGGGRFSRGVLFGGAISFLGGPGTVQVLEAAEDPPIRREEPQQADQAQEAADNTKKTNSDTGNAGLDARLQDLLERLRLRQKKKADAAAGKKTDAALEAEEGSAGGAAGNDDRYLSVLVEELGGQGLSIQKAQSYYGGEAVTVYLGEANMKGSVRRIFAALGNLLLWILIFCALYFAFSSYQERRTGKPFFFMGYKPVLILSESMEPTYPKGAIVLVRKQRDSAEPGDVVMFSPEEGSGYVIHRIVGESEAGFITRGDHNNTEDRGAVAPEQILGTVKGLIWC